MESLQCLEDTPDITITNELCFPSISQVVDDILIVSKHTNIYTIYIASDSQPNISELQQKLGSKVSPILLESCDNHVITQIKLYFLSPERPQVDLAILGKSDYFIGNCVSSFSAFVKRERDVFGKPSTFWGYKKLNTLKEEL